MSCRRNLVWLGLTPEPERELPTVVAALRFRTHGSGTHGSRPHGSRTPTGTPSGLAEAERLRVQELILHGTRHSWLRYLGEVTALVVDAADTPAHGDPEAALTAGDVVLDHHRMLIGLPGPGYERTAAQRQALEEALRRLRNRTRNEGAA
ncbi:hypothetical protein G3I60_02150 [Streptomyces sp. SID13666]|uniref:hypothetical protein n=1 Tax=unclassified Streptomyces TaxID=2593676 RepID=UPI0013C052CD|nr:MULTISPECIES: hypothetical protein [unclassified Streptomyces]NEA53009.1 hypothetical protein [Streptomyces sp. SID13666]NEA69664.1 hypothetical protein [Streptomyces sp. SID13588]